MKASIFYRIASILLLLFALGHTLGFRQSDPAWGADGLLSLMRSLHFSVQGFSRTYWDIFTAAGFALGIFYFFAAALAWHPNWSVPFLCVSVGGFLWIGCGLGRIRLAGAGRRRSPPEGPVATLGDPPER